MRKVSDRGAGELPTGPGVQDGYSDALLSHFRRPRNAGRLAGPDALGTAENFASGATMEIQLAVSDGRIREARFQAEGCTATIAAGSAVTELLVGKSPQAAAELARSDVERALGGLPPTRKHASALAVDAVRAALKDLAARRGQ